MAIWFIGTRLPARGATGISVRRCPRRSDHEIATDAAIRRAGFSSPLRAVPGGRKIANFKK